MQVISVVSSKGGVGKTTLTTALAVAAVADGKKVVLVDLDPQASLAGWYARRKGKDGASAALVKNLDLFEDAEKASEAVEALSASGGKIDYVFIDTPPAFLATIEDAIEAANVVIIPLRPSALDIMASEDAVLLARETETPHLAVINDAEPKWKTTDSAASYLKAAKVPVAATIITHRSAYLSAMAPGKTGPEMDRTGVTKGEIAELWAEVKAALRKAKKKA